MFMLKINLCNGGIMDQQENSSNANDFFENQSFFIEHFADFEMKFNQIFEELINIKEINDKSKELLLLEIESIDKQNQSNYSLQKNPNEFNSIHEKLGKYKQISTNQAKKISFLKLKIDEFKKIIDIKEEKINLLSNEINIIKNNFLGHDFAESLNLINETEHLDLIIDKNNEIEKLNKIIMILKRYNIDKDIEIKNLNKLLINKEDFITKEVNEFDDRILELQESESFKHEEILRLTDTIELKDEKISGLEKLINDYCSDIESLNKVVEDNKNKIKSLNEDLSIGKSKINKYEQDIFLLTDTIKNKNIEHAILKEHLNNSKKGENSLSLKNDELNDELLEKNNEISNLKDIVDSLKLVSDEKENTIASLMKEISILNNVIDEKDETIDFLKTGGNNV